jgi:hypothetical protein
MSVFTRFILILAITQLISCGRDGDQKFRGFDHLKNPVFRGETALKAPAELNPDAKTLEYQTKGPAPTDKSYLKVEHSFKQGKKNLHISAHHLILSPNHSQGVWELINQNEDLDSVTLEAYEIELNSELRLPIRKLTVLATKFKATAASQIDIRPTEMLEAKQGKDGQRPYRAELIFVAEKLELATKNQIIINASGARGQKAGAGPAGRPGRSVRTLSGNIVQKCKSVCTQRAGQGAGGSTMLSFGGAETKAMCMDWSWVCEVKDFKWPTNGLNATAPGKPGHGGDAALIKVSSHQWIKHITAKGGQAGEEAITAPGGDPGSPRVAIKIKGKKKTVKKLKKGDDAHPPKVDLSSMKGKDGEFLESSFDLSLSFMERALALRLKYLKDLYRSGHFNKSYNQMGKLVSLLRRIPNKSPAILKTQVEATQLLTRLQQGLDYFKARLGSAPMLSLEATGLNFKSEMKRAIKFTAFSTWLEAHQESQQQVKSGLLEQQKNLFEEKQIHIRRHKKATAGLRSLQQLNALLERQYLVVQDKYEKQKKTILNEAINNISAKKYSTLKKALRSAAALASVIPVGQPTASLVAQTLQAFISLQDAQGSFNTMAIPKLISTVSKDYKLEETLINWNQLVSRYSLKQLKNLNTNELKERIVEIHHLASPLYELLEKQSQIWSHSKLSRHTFEKELHRLKEINPSFQELALEIEELSTIRTNYLQELNQTLEMITESQSRITQIIQDIASLSPQMAYQNRQLNPNVLEVTRRRQELYQEELLSYQAQLARAYQYKNLRPYPHRLNLEAMQNFLMRIMANKDDSSLSDDELERVELIYIEQLSSIFKSILDSTAQKGPRHEKRVILRLTEDEKFALSKNKKVYIDLTSRGVYARDEEEILIEGLKVDRATVESDQSFELKMEHEGRGLIQKNGEDYYFNYLTRAGNSIFKWGHHFDPQGQHNSGHRQLIYRERNLFLSFMADTVAPQLANDLDIYTRPAGKASLKLEIQSSKSVKIQHLDLELTYSFYEKN